MDREELEQHYGAAETAKKSTKESAGLNKNYIWIIVVIGICYLLFTSMQGSSTKQKMQGSWMYMDSISSGLYQHASMKISDNKITFKGRETTELTFKTTGGNKINVEGRTCKVTFRGNTMILSPGLSGYSDEEWHKSTY